MVSFGFLSVFLRHRVISPWLSCGVRMFLYGFLDLFVGFHMFSLWFSCGVPKFSYGPTLILLCGCWFGPAKLRFHMMGKKSCRNVPRTHILAAGADYR